MTPLTLQDVLAHQVSVPWPELYQVEQDLLLSLSMHAIFEDAFLSTQVAMRGGTVLHKVHLAPAARYSEDIDLVAVGERPEGHIGKALLRGLRPVLGKEKSTAWATLRLAVCNAARPSRILRCVYKVPSVTAPERELTVEVETNVPSESRSMSCSDCRSSWNSAVDASRARSSHTTSMKCWVRKCGPCSSARRGGTSLIFTGL